MECPVSFDLCQDLSHRHSLSHYFQCFPGASLGTFSADCAARSVYRKRRVIATDRFLRAGLQAVLAQCAAVISEDELRLEGTPLWIVAPLAGERAAFQEYRGSDSRAIMDGVTSDVEYPAAGCFFLYSGSVALDCYHIPVSLFLVRISTFLIMILLTHPLIINEGKINAENEE